nr:unnamed protein product [Callosobruchus chinensis]
MSSGRKRRYSSETDEKEFLEWKISKLQQRLNERSRSRSRDRRTVSPSLSHSSRERTAIAAPTVDQPRSSRRQEKDTSRESEYWECSDDDDDPPLSVIAANNGGQVVEHADEEVPSLDSSILALLGDEQPAPEPSGPSIHQDIATRWSFILNKGLGEEAVTKLMKKYPPPDNCLLLKAPSVNLEVAAAVRELETRRDQKLAGQQSQIGSALASLGQLTTGLISEGGSANHPLIELASDASRLLLDLHYKYSSIRRELLILGLRKDLKDTLVSASADGWLFGKDLGERIKASKDIEKSGLDLKAKPSKTVNKPPNPNNREAFPAEPGKRLPSTSSCTQDIQSGWTKQPSRAHPPTSLPDPKDSGPGPSSSTRGPPLQEIEGGEISTPPTVATAYPGCRALIQQGLELRGTPKTATEVCLASITASTIKQYNSGLKLWYQFCHTKNESCFSASATVVLEFLQEQYDRGASYGTLNSYRSAIAQLLGPSMSEDILIRRFFKGVFHLRPNLPKYKNTWDPLIVLNYLKTLDNENISLEQISYKLAMLLALVSAQRVQTLSLIELKDIKSSSQGVQIFVSSRIKTSGPNREQPIIALPFYEADRAICKPHHNASSQTISRWIRNVLSKAGIDPNKYTSHSTRHASTSLADRKGISVDVIRAAAGWSQQSKTFAIFYKRPVCDTYAYARALLE